MLEENLYRSTFGYNLWSHSLNLSLGWTLYNATTEKEFKQKGLKKKKCKMLSDIDIKIFS